MVLADLHGHRCSCMHATCVLKLTPISMSQKFLQYGGPRGAVSQCFWVLHASESCAKGCMHGSTAPHPTAPCTARHLGPYMHHVHHEGKAHATPGVWLKYQSDLQAMRKFPGTCMSMLHA